MKTALSLDAALRKESIEQQGPGELHFHGKKC